MAENRNALDTPVDQVKVQKDLPEGEEYEFVVASYQTGESPDKKTPYVDIKARAVRAVTGDVEIDDTYWPVNHRFWTTEKAVGQLVGFLNDTLGLPKTDNFGDALTSRELLEDAVGLAFNGVVGIEMRGKNKDRPARILVAIRPAQD